MLSFLKKTFIGETLRTDQLNDEKFSVFWGIPILSSDAISSVAYAGEAILLVLFPIIGLNSYKYMFYAALCIVLLLFMLVFSYSQTIDSYPNGGGSYIVAKDNLGTIPGLTAGAALSVDYILTVAVSVSSGVAAITSAVPFLLPHKVGIAVAVIFLMAIGNLRGMKDSARMFGVPTYLFIVSIALLIIIGIFKVKVLGIQPVNYNSQIKFNVGNISLLLFLRAFASGCTALTGVEAVSNGIPNFKEPAQKNAKTVLLILACIVLFIFGGLSYLATIYHAVPSENVTVIAQIAAQVFGKNFMFFLVQGTTAIILVIAANTAYADLPLLMSLIAKDGYAPRQFTKRGKRLSFSNGIILLAIVSSILVIMFKANEQRLLPLYAVGVFISFTLSQFGMFTKWVKSKSKGWIHKAIINGLGSLVTFCVAILIGITKFIHGAWFTCIMIVLLVVIMIKIKKHYNKVAEQLKLLDAERPKECLCTENTQHFIILVDSLNKTFLKSLNYAHNLSTNIVAFHVSTDEEATTKLKKRWAQYNPGIPLIIKTSSYRDVFEPLKEFIEDEEKNSDIDDNITVIIPQFVVTKWWHNILHNQTALFIKNMLHKKRNVVVITIPYIIEN